MPAKIIFSNINDQGESVANFACTVAKQYIFRMKCLKLNLNFEDLKDEIMFLYDTEKKAIASFKKASKFNRKWNQNVTFEDYVDQYLQTA